MAKVANHVFSTNSRIIKDLLTQYKNTFYAFCELINNSIQANSTVIDIKVDYAKSELTKAPIKGITIRDNGNGVSYEFGINKKQLSNIEYWNIR